MLHLFVAAVTVPHQSLPVLLLKDVVDDKNSSRSSTSTGDCNYAALVESSKGEEARPGTNKPHLRQLQILSALEQCPVALTVSFTNTIALSDTLRRLYDAAYSNAFRDAWRSAKQAQDKHWFDPVLQSLTPLNFPRGHPLMCEEQNLRLMPPYKAMAAYMNDTMTPVYEQTFMDACCSVQNTMDATLSLLARRRAGLSSPLPSVLVDNSSVSALMSCETPSRDIAYALNSMPGHHSDHILSARGYCYYNNRFR